MARDGDIRRFDGSTRWVHWATAVLFAVLVLTALTLYVGPISVAVGRRALMADIHTYAGLALPLPILLGLASQAFRDDLHRLDRFGPYDWRWLRDKTARRTGALSIGKFNAGQKLNAALTAGAILVLLGTGIMLWRPDGLPVALRTGATFVHDVSALLFVVLVIGHLRFALRDPQARRAMRTGWVGLAWARLHHPGWAEQVEDATEADEEDPSLLQAGEPARGREHHDQREYSDDADSPQDPVH